MRITFRVTNALQRLRKQADTNNCELGVRAVKALRFAPPALRAAGGLDRASGQAHSAINLGLPRHTLRMHIAVLLLS